MKAAVVNSFQSPPQYADFPAPVAGDGERLVHVTAAGLHPIVKSRASGQHYTATADFPFVAGLDGAGKLDDGTRVFFGMARPPFGAMAELSLAPDWMCLPLPEGVDDVTAAALCNPGMSGWAAMQRAGFAPGQSVLILGATGNAGRLAVQIARRRGAGHIIAAGRNPQALETLPALGADTVISLNQPQEQLQQALQREYLEHRFDVVLDYVWGAPAEAAIVAIAKAAAKSEAKRVRYVQIGGIAGATIPLPAAALRSTGLELLGSGFGSASMADLVKAVAALLQEAAQQPFVFQTTLMPLSDLAEAWAMKNSQSRIVLQP